ncbi:MAG: MbnP family protein [Bacteroidota bacterium]
MGRSTFLRSVCNFSRKARRGPQSHTGQAVTVGPQATQPPTDTHPIHPLTLSFSHPVILPRLFTQANAIRPYIFLSHLSSHPIIRLTCYPIILLSLLTSCYQEVSGCLDVNATNFDLDADFACPDDCCNYPTLGVAVTHNYADQSLRTDTFYLDAQNNPFRISRLRYYWSELQLDQLVGEAVVPVDSVEMGLLTSTGDTVFQNLNNNIVLVNSTSSATQTFGTFRSVATSTGLSGRIGLRNEYASVIPSTVPTGNPLFLQEGKMHFGSDSNFVQLKLEYDLIEGSDTTSKTINVIGDQALIFPFVNPLEIPQGFNLTVRLTADVSSLLNGIDLASMESEIADQLAQNAPFIWTVTSVEGR